MRPMNLILAGILMCAAGATLVFSGFDEVPLWAIWLVGPMLWYLGFVFACAGFITHLFRVARTQMQSKAQRVLRPQRRTTDAPACLQHEVPPMGGFLL